MLLISELAEQEMRRAKMLKTVKPGDTPDARWLWVWELLVEENLQIPAEDPRGSKVVATVGK